MTRPQRVERTATLAGREVRYTVIASPRAARARIRVGPGGVEVVVPRTAPPGRAAAFLAERAWWVVAQLDRLEGVGGIRRPVPSADPGTILFRGERVPVRVDELETARRYAVVRRDESGIAVATPRGRPELASAGLERWLRRRARAVIGGRVAARAGAMRLAPGRVYIRGQRTKWGNCSRLGNLSFNWRLVMAPERVLDAIVIHELAHLVEPTHAARFWLIVRSHCPDYDARVRWLADHHAALFVDITAAAGAAVYLSHSPAFPAQAAGSGKTDA